MILPEHLVQGVVKFIAENNIRRIKIIAERDHGHEINKVNVKLIPPRFRDFKHLVVKKNLYFVFDQVDLEAVFPCKYL